MKKGSKILDLACGKGRHALHLAKKGFQTTGVDLSEESINRRGLFSAQSVQKLIFDNDNGKIDASYTLLSLLCIEIWCRVYIDR